MKSYKKTYLRERYNITTTTYNYDEPMKIFKYIDYLRKILRKLLKNPRSKEEYINETIIRLNQIAADIEYFQDESIDLIYAPIEKIRRRLILISEF